MSAEPDPPSTRAVERLATGVEEDVADLRTQFHQALERADRLEAGGRRDLAVEVLEDQRDVLLEVHRRLEARLAQAAVEREAERVVDAAAVGGGVAAADAGRSGPLDEGSAGTRAARPSPQTTGSRSCWSGRLLAAAAPVVASARRAPRTVMMQR